MQCIIPGIILLLVITYFWQNMGNTPSRFNMIIIGIILLMFACSGIFVAYINR